MAVRPSFVRSARNEAGATRPLSECVTAAAASAAHAHPIARGRLCIAVAWSRCSANDRARSIILANADARALGVPLPHSARKVQWARQKLDTYITHRDVIFKALIMGLPVPADVLADYPDIAARLQKAKEKIKR